MVQRPPFDNDRPPAPGGFDPRYGREDRAPDPRGGPDPRFADERRYGEEERRYNRDPRDPRDPYAGEPDPFDRRGPVPPASRPAMARSTEILLALGGLLLLIVALFALTLGRSGAGSDALDNASDNGTAATEPEDRCAAPATYEKIKRELFRQAAAQRGTDQSVFDRLSSYASIRVTSPVLREEDEGLQRVSCSGNVAIDLPPGVQVVGNRRSLSAAVQYSLQPAADGNGDVVTLTGAEPITAPLATLGRVATSPAAPSSSTTAPPPTEPITNPNQLPSRPAPVTPPPPPSPAPAPPAPPRADPQVSTRPSFNCANARTRGEIAVCGSSDLAALDRQMAGFYVEALRGADSSERALLQRTRDRFLTYRDRCRSNSCVADAYRGRISEIRDIVDGRWRGQ
ncbi:hypothetical protein GCM10022280_14690 [Sphingomonas swuensis]|uniref:DUF1311 domain-containing protein n=1 Tax=Sphingomonas swuensis TaxID=977800 RepID=A0ABP7SUH6_9SPHN